MKLKKFLIFSFLIIFPILLIFSKLPKKSNDPETVVTECFAAIKRMDFKRANDYIYPQANLDALSKKSDDEIEMLAAFLSKTELEVLDVIKTKDGAKVDVEILVPDLQWCYNKVFESSMFQEATISDNKEDCMKKLPNAFKNTFIATMKNHVPWKSIKTQLILKMQNGKMMINNNDILVDFNFKITLHN